MANLTKILLLVMVLSGCSNSKEDILKKVKVKSYLINGVYWAGIERGTKRVLSKEEVEDRVRNIKRYHKQ